MCFNLVYICFKQWHNLAFILIGHVGGSCDEDIQIQIYHHAIGSRIQQRDIKIHYIIMSSGQDSAEDSVLATFAEGIPAIVTAWTSSCSWYSTNVCYRKCIATAEHSARQALTCARPIYSKNMCYQKRIVALATPEHLLSARRAPTCITSA